MATKKKAKPKLHPKKAEPKAPKIINLGHEVVDPASLVFYKGNPRQGDLEAIEASIRENGFYGDVVVRKSNRQILVGNNRTKVAMKLGMPKVPIAWVEVDDKTASRMVAVDNRTNDLASYDGGLLKALVQELKEQENLLGSGFTEIDFAKMLEGSIPAAPTHVEFGAQSATTHKCPKCQHQWNGKSK